MTSLSVFVFSPSSFSISTVGSFNFVHGANTSSNPNTRGTKNASTRRIAALYFVTHGRVKACGPVRRRAQIHEHPARPVRHRFHLERLIHAPSIRRSRVRIVKKRTRTVARQSSASSAASVPLSMKDDLFVQSYDLDPALAAFASSAAPHPRVS